MSFRKNFNERMHLDSQKHDVNFGEKKCMKIV